MYSLNLRERAGKHCRNNYDRYFHVMAQGWFIYTREGIRGPFIEKTDAENYLTNLLYDIQGERDPSESWRL